MGAERTREAKKLEKASLRRARMHGHSPQLITESGVLRLYGCAERKCTQLLEAWDMPPVAAGAMIHTGCEARLKRNSVVRLRRKIWLLIREGRWT